MNLIIKGHSSDKAYAARIAYVIIKTGKRARTDQHIRSKIRSASVAIVPVTVGGSTVYRTVRIAPVRVLGRIEEGCRTDDRIIRII